MKVTDANDPWARIWTPGSRWAVNTDVVGMETESSDRLLDVNSCRSETADK
jgi:hypothetical protein